MMKKADYSERSVHTAQFIRDLTYRKTIFFQRFLLRPGDPLLAYTVLWDAINTIMQRIL